MHRLHFAAALGTALMLAACGPSPIDAPQNYAVVYGRVYDAVTNQAVSGVTVAVDVVDTAVSGADGSYTVSNVPVGQTDVTVSLPPGYSAAAPSAFNFSVSNGQRYRLDIPLNHG